MIQHLKERDGGYVEHLVHAWTFGFKFLFLTGCVFIHGVFPNLFPDTSEEMERILKEH